jgi:CheY-like chemotaxis protein
MITTEALNGHSCRVLVVEDEALIAMLVEDMIHDSGGEMVGPAAKLSDAVDLARNAQADVALLDLNLGGALAYPVADVLRHSRMKPLYAQDRSAICSEVPPFAGFYRVSAPVTFPKAPQP